MAVDAERGKFHINVIQPSEIGALWSAQSYRPEVTKAIRKVKSMSWMPLQKLVANAISPGPHPVYGGTYPCLKTKNVQDLLADPEPYDFADVSGYEEERQLQAVQVKYGDLLINLTGAGSIGRVSIYYDHRRPITNQHVARMSMREGVDEAYVAAFLRSYWGERCLEQGVAGTTGQINMVNDHVRCVPVPIPDQKAREYIGNKVRQAERLRAWAKAMQAAAARALPHHFRLFRDRADTSYTVAENALSEARLDGHFYQPEYTLLDVTVQVALPNMGLRR